MSNSSAAIVGIGALLNRGNDNSPETFTSFGEVNTIGFGPKKEMIDVTHLSSTEKYRIFISGLKDGGQVTANLNFVAADFAILWSDFEDEDSHSYKIILPDAGAMEIAFEGFVTDPPLTVTMDKQITMEVTIKITGKPTVTP